MANQMITLKLENNFLKDVDNFVKKEGFQNRTEFIRNALREKIDRTKIKIALLELEKLQGSSRKKISDEEYKRVREEAFEMLN